MPLHKVTCVPRGHALGIVSDDGIMKKINNDDGMMDRPRNYQRMIGSRFPIRRILRKLTYVWAVELLKSSVRIFIYLFYFQDES
jgi:hypothetical protein